LPASAPPPAPTSPAARATRPAPASVDWRVAGLLALVTVALYWPVHAYDFVNFDDVDYVRSNAAVRAGLAPSSLAWAFTNLQVAGFWIPLTWLSLMLDSQLFGTGAGGYHVTNVALHVANTVLVFLLLHAATGRRWPSAFVAAAFALHPLHVESVAWVTERKDVLSTLLLLLTLWSYGVYAARPTRRRYLVTLAVFVLGLMAKPMLTTMAALLLVLDVWPLGRIERVPVRRLVLEKVPFLALALPAALVVSFVGHPVDVSDPLAGIPLFARFADVCESYLLPLARTVWPVGLAVHYPDHPPPSVGIVLLQAATLLAATGAALWLGRRRRWIAAGWLWYGIALAPVSGVVKIGHFATADRFTYVPLLGIFVMLAWGAAELTTTRVRAYAVTALATAALVAVAVLARVQLGYWRDGVTLFERTIAVTGDNPVAQYLLGLALAERGRTDEAMAHYRESLRVRPGYAHVHTSLGVLLFERGRIDEAIAHYTAALEEDRGEMYAHANLANALWAQGRREDALAHYAEALRLGPEVAELHVNHGRALAELGRRDEAVAAYEAALRLRPDDPDAHNNLANVLADRGALEQAAAHYASAVRTRPDHAGVRVNYGLFLAQQGRFAEAVEQYAAALRLRPDDAALRRDMGNALAQQGRLDAAVVEFREALRLAPGDAGTHVNLANALVLLGRVDDGLAEYAEALRLDPGFAQAHANLGTALARSGRMAEAVAHFREALRLDPHDAGTRRSLDAALDETSRR
jgi:tetratricopeptide (TPR) repeat protein